MSSDRVTTLFFELFDGLPRQGPGEAASTLRALALVTRHRPADPHPRHRLRYRLPDAGSGA